MSITDELVEAMLNPLDEAFEAEGLTIDFYAKGIKELCVFKSEGKRKPTRLDMHVRKSGHEMLARSRGLYAAEKHEHKTSMTVNVINFSEAEDKNPET